MSKICAICGKTRVSGYKVSHSHKKSKRVFYPNLQTVRINGKKIKVCGKCIKSLGKKK